MEPTTNKIMTLDDAIAHAEEVAQRHRDQAAVDAERSGHFVKSPIQCNKCADEHEQLAIWLKQLKEIRHIVDNWCTDMHDYDNGSPVDYEKYFMQVVNVL